MVNQIHKELQVRGMAREGHAQKRGVLSTLVLPPEF